MASAHDNKLRFPLRIFQKESARFLFKKRRALLALSMGAGKTRTVLEAIEMDYCNDPQADTKCHDVLILCGKNSQPTWKNEIAKWFEPEYHFTYLTGTPQYRSGIWKRLLRHDFNKSYNFFVCTYATFVIEAKANPKVAALRWDYIIIDEAQKLRNRKPALTKNVMRHVTEKNSPVLYLVSGKPVRKGPQDLWTLIRMINKKWFPSYWKFVNTYCIVEDFGFGQEVFGVRNAEALRQFLKKFMIRYTKEDVEKELPEKSRYKLYVTPTAEQIRLYDSLVDDMLAMESTDEGLVLLHSSSDLGIGVKLRQLLVCPKILDERLGYGAGIESILEQATVNDERHFVIFMPFTAGMSYIERYLHLNGYKDVFTIKGGMDPGPIDEACSNFESTKGVALISVEFAESFSLPSCGTGYMLGSSWNPDTNEQAEDRLRRLSSVHRHLQIWYVTHEGTIDERVFEILNRKNRNAAEVLRKPQDFRRLI